MSKGKRNHKEHHGRKAKQPKSDSRSTSIFDILFPAVLAILVSAAILLQLTSPRSMFSAICRVEGMALSAGKPLRSGLSRGTTWDDLFRARDAKLRRHADMPEHFALANLFRLYAETQRGSLDIHEAAEKARGDALQAPDNLIARLIHADLKDRAQEAMALETKTDAGSAPPARFEAFRAIVKGDRAVTHTTLFNAECTNVWFGVVQQYLQQRPDVAVSITPAVYHYRIDDHFELLPILAQRITALAADLRASGHEEAATQCNRWIAQACFGLMDADPDAGTRLLCSDILLTVLDEQSDAAQRLRDLRQDYHQHAEAASIDLADQSFVLRPATMPETYGTALRPLLAALTFALAAWGAGATLLIVGLVAIPARLITKRKKDYAPITATKRLPRFYVIAPFTLVPSLIAALLMLWQYAEHGVHSQTWGLFAAIAIVLAGALTAVTIAGFAAQAKSSNQRGRVALVVLFMLGGLLMLLLSPSRVAGGLRSVDLLISVMPVLYATTAIIIAASLWITPARLRSIAAIAALVCCVNICTAFVIYQFHRAADRDYQKAVVSIGFDELAARLGPDWQTHYLDPARKELLGAAE